MTGFTLNFNGLPAFLVINFPNNFKTFKNFFDYIW
jgi:hypothetical protein